MFSVSSIKNDSHPFENHGLFEDEQEAINVAQSLLGTNHIWNTSVSDPGNPIVYYDQWGRAHNKPKHEFDNKKEGNCG